MSTASHETALEDVTGAERFQRLSAEDRALYTERCQRMVRFARDHAVPIMFAPPLSEGGELNGATGCLVRLAQGTFVVTASHVLEGYERRREQGEMLHWQTSRGSGRDARFSTLSRNGVSVRTSAGVYATDEPARDQRGLALLPDPPTLLRLLPLLPDEE